MLFLTSTLIWSRYMQLYVELWRNVLSLGNTLSKLNNMMKKITNFKNTISSKSLIKLQATLHEIMREYTTYVHATQF